MLEESTKTIEEWRDAKKTPDFFYAGAKVLHGWPLAKRMTEGEYDAAVDAFAKEPLR